MRNYTTIHTQSQIVSPIQGYSVFDFLSVLWDESRPGGRSYRIVVSYQYGCYAPFQFSGEIRVGNRNVLLGVFLLGRFPLIGYFLNFHPPTGELNVSRSIKTSIPRISQNMIYCNPTAIQTQEAKNHDPKD